MSFLGRIMSTGAKFLGKVAPAAQFLGRIAPSVLNTTASVLNNPLTSMLAQKAGINPMALRQAGSIVSNVGAGVNMVPGVIRDAQSSFANVRSAVRPAEQSLASLYRTAMG